MNKIILLNWISNILIYHLDIFLFWWFFFIFFLVLILLFHLFHHFSKISRCFRNRFLIRLIWLISELFLFKMFHLEFFWIYICIIKSWYFCLTFNRSFLSDLQTTFIVPMGLFLIILIIIFGNFFTNLQLSLFIPMSLILIFC